MNDADIIKSYKRQQYRVIINLYNADSQRKSQIFELFAGFVFTELGLAEKALECFAKVDKSQLNSYCGKIHRYVGLSNYLLSNYDLAQSAFYEGSENGDDESGLWKQLLFPDLFTIHETESIIFRFVDYIPPFDLKVFLIKNMKALKRINGFIGKNYCRKKIDIYVYAKRTDSLGNTLSYSDNGLKTIYTYAYDMCGHEIAHIIFNSIYNEMSRNQFIDEGIATFFDQEQTYEMFIKYHYKNFAHVDVISLWKASSINLRDIREYYVAGAFVGFLIHTYGKGKFLEFIQNQSYDNARKVFGPSLDFYIESFYKDIY